LSSRPREAGDGEFSELRLASCLLSPFACGDAADSIHALTGQRTGAAFARRLPGRLQPRIRYRQAGIHTDKQRWQIRRDRPFLATPLLVVSRLRRSTAHAAMAHRGHFGAGCSRPALDASGHGNNVALVCLCLGDTIAASERFKFGQNPYQPASADEGRARRADPSHLQTISREDRHEHAIRYRQGCFAPRIGLTLDSRALGARSCCGARCA